jgi:hypothetical protein
MQRILVLTILVVASSVPATAQQRGGGGGFSFDKCISRCMGWNDAYHCSRACGRKQAEIQWRQKLSGEGRGPQVGRNDPLHPRSPRFHDPDPRYHRQH